MMSDFRGGWGGQAKSEKIGQAKSDIPYSSILAGFFSDMNLPQCVLSFAYSIILLPRYKIWKQYLKFLQISYIIFLPRIGKKWIILETSSPIKTYLYV